MVPGRMTRIVKGVRYDTQRATCIAHDCFWDGHNHERHGRNTYLYRTAGGRYFRVDLTQWHDEQDTLAPLTQEEAIALYEGLTEHEVTHEVAFPGVQVVEA